LITTLIIKFRYIIFVNKQKRPELEKPYTEKEFLTELRERLSEIHYEAWRVILEGRRVIQLHKFETPISAALPLPLFLSPINNQT